MNHVKNMGRAAAVLVLLLHAAPGAAQNLVTNSQFNASTAGWSKRLIGGSATLGFDAGLDANASPQSGSAFLANTSATANVVVSLAQCFPASAGQKLVWGGRLRFREGEATLGNASTILSYFDGPNCTGAALFAIGGEQFTPLSDGRGVWLDGGFGTPSVGVVAPAGTESAALGVRILKTGAGASLTVAADKLFVALAGSPRCQGQIPTIVGSNGPDTLEGTPGTDVIMGLGGPDEIFAAGGFDVVCGGGGADTLEGGPGTDILDGGAGEDVLLGGGGNDLLIGGGSNDSCAGGAGNADLAASCEITSTVP
jgi:Ca2+-binding RTX toxin-like protein